jgi:hypothetical protein
MKSKSILKSIAIVVLSAGLMVGCADGGTKASAKKAGPSPAASKAITAAITMNNKAKAVNYEWRDTGKLIKKAKKAAKKGHNKKAIKLANKAKSQAALAIKQAAFEKTMDRSVR